MDETAGGRRRAGGQNRRSLLSRAWRSAAARAPAWRLPGERLEDLAVFRGRLARRLGFGGQAREL